jgi:hypothetical protein
MNYVQIYIREPHTAEPSVNRARCIDWHCLSDSEQFDVQQFYQNGIEPRSTRAQVYIRRHIMESAS